MQKYKDNPNAATTTNAAGGKQSATEFACHLLPPEALLEVAAVLKTGADKYGVDNWKRIPVDDHINHLLTHALQANCIARRGSTEPQEVQAAITELIHLLCRGLFALDLFLRKYEELQ